MQLAWMLCHVGGRNDTRWEYTGRLRVRSCSDPLSVTSVSSSESVEYATLDDVGVSNCVLFRSSFMIKFMAHSLTACLLIEYIGRIDHVFSSPAMTA
jgi:hypothetical protein